MKRKIICTNEDGMEVVFSSTFSPFLLESCDGIYSVQNNVTSSENTMTDGSTYQGSVTQMRNIVLTLWDRPDADHQANSKPAVPKSVFQRPQRLDGDDGRVEGSVGIRS